MLKILNSQTGEVRATLGDDPADILIRDEVTGKTYSLTEYRKLQKERQQDGDSPRNSA